MGPRVIGGSLLAFLTLLVGSASPPRAERAVIERVVWAWERPEDLRFPSKHSNVRVAYLAETLDVVRSEVRVSPRRQPLKLPHGMSLVGVIRVQVAADSGALPASARGLIVERSVLLAKGTNVAEVQIDFDARRSERKDYRELLTEIRAALPRSTRLSMTALASWCLFDDWLSDSHLPVDDIVPMFFEMGRGASEARSALRRSADFTAPACRRSVGISTDEGWPELPGARRVWIFNRKSWTEAEWVRVARELS